MNLEPTRHGESTPGPENADGGQLVREKKSGRLGLGGAEGLGPGGRTYTNGPGVWTTICQLGQRELLVAWSSRRPLNLGHVCRVHRGELRMKLAH